MDSSVKRNGALTKKIRGCSEENISALLKECMAVNQAKVRVHDSRFTKCIWWRQNIFSVEFLVAWRF